MALTRDAVFWDSFAAHADRSVRAVALLEQMFAKPSEAPALHAQIETLESEGDALTREVVVALHKTWITPLDRDAIHALVTTLDDVLDYFDAVAERFTLYEIRESRPEALEIVRILVVATGDMAKAVAGLTNLKNPQPLLDLCNSINRHESAVDSIYRRALARLFKERGDAIDVIMWRDLFTSLETAADRLEDIADIIEGIILEHA